MKWIISIMSLFSAIQVQAQIQISQEVVGSLGHMTGIQGSHIIGATAGEALISTEHSTKYTLTQGFHQPPMMAAISFTIATAEASCPTSTDGSARIENLTGCRPPYIITWSFGHEGLEVDRLAPGLYSVGIQAGYCSFTQEFEIFYNSEAYCKLLFFKAFSPNGDGLNDGWEIENINRPEFSENHVEIFNRWGQTVWSGSGYNNSDVMWTGETDSGSALPDGTYFYVATAGGVVYKSFVELTR